MSETFDVFIAKAVLDHQPLEFIYQGHQRLVVPMLLGKTRLGDLVLHGFQFGGGTSKGVIVGPMEGQWKYFYLNEIPEAIYSRNNNAPLLLNKSEGESYQPPAFITKILAIAPR